MILSISKYDFRLLEVESELYALEDHLKLIESHGAIPKERTSQA
jgi:hypothetical protein